MTAVGKALVLGPGAGRMLEGNAHRMTIKLEADDRSPEGFALVEYTVTPGLPPNPPHVHRTFDEAWYILEGDVEFTLGTHRELATPGTFIFAPRGAPHQFRVRGSTPARWLTIFSPGRYFHMVEELLAVLPPGGGPPPAEAWKAILERYDSEVVGEGEIRDQGRGSMST